jgi:hypothetical protein
MIMAAFSNFHLIESGELSRRASNPVAPRPLQRWAGRFAAIVRETVAAAGEIVLFLWTILVLGFALLVAAGFLA